MTKNLTQNVYRNMNSVALSYQTYVSRTATFLAVVCAVSAFVYGVFLLETVAHAASSTQAQRQIRSITEKMSALEGQYLSLTQSLTPTKAKELGFVPPQEVATVYATGDSHALSFLGR